MKALFDLSFDKFVAPLVAKIIYVLVLIAVAIGYLAFVVTSFQANAGIGILVLLVIGPVLALLYLAFVRVGLESLLASILTARNTAELIRLQGGRPPTMSDLGNDPSTPPSAPEPGYPTAPPSTPGYPPSAPPTPPSQ